MYLKKLPKLALNTNQSDMISNYFFNSYNIFSLSFRSYRTQLQIFPMPLSRVRTEIHHLVSAMTKFYIIFKKSFISNIRYKQLYVMTAIAW
jgi:hypothetical protein